MRGDLPPLTQYSFMAWRSIKARGKLYRLPLLASIIIRVENAVL
jgi:hypothetical protein